MVDGRPGFRESDLLSRAPPHTSRLIVNSAMDLCVPGSSDDDGEQSVAQSGRCNFDFRAWGEFTKVVSQELGYGGVGESGVWHRIVSSRAAPEWPTWLFVRCVRSGGDGGGGGSSGGGSGCCGEGCSRSSQRSCPEEEVRIEISCLEKRSLPHGAWKLWHRYIDRKVLCAHVSEA